MAVYHCSDSFLKQNMITKLSQCQYALPLLVPDHVTMDIECPLWTFREIIKTWKITQSKDDSNIVTMKNMPICKAQTPMVSFFRLGSPSESKSQLMNTLINERHSTFFHRNCPGSTKSRHLMDGVAEIAWYCPAGKPNDAFTDCTAFCNLHDTMSSQSHSKDVANELIEKIHTWIQFQKEAAQKLEKLASEVEKNYRNVNISKVVGSSVSTVGALSMVGAGVLTFLTAGLASPLLVAGIGATAAGLVTNVASDITEMVLSSKTTEETKEISEKIEKLEKEICDLIDSLKEEEKKREEQTGSFNVPCENRVLDRIFGAIAKLYGLDFHYSKSLSSIASMSGGSKALLIGISVVVRKGCKTIAKTALSRGLYFTIGATAAKGLGRVGGGAVGLGFSIYDLVKSSTNVNNPETDVSKALREYATDIRRDAGKLDGEFDQIQETFKMLAKVKVGLEKFERSPNDKKTLVESAIENCKDEDAVQWLKTNSQHEALAEFIEWSKLI
ncbi:hypothetical protein Q5P01_017671 [Channa striata]|uniref:Up-regulator of cell proliferation-like domain-containing protein n=1 Tax=Channa striata TaxID=64152 RepID=A0AA88SHM8_CHASR|nr:hypothetical protein Q5P01_017671 [Channa striata]